MNKNSTMQRALLRFLIIFNKTLIDERVVGYCSLILGVMAWAIPDQATVHQIQDIYGIQIAPLIYLLITCGAILIWRGELDDMSLYFALSTPIALYNFATIDLLSHSSVSPDIIIVEFAFGIVVFSRLLRRLTVRIAHRWLRETDEFPIEIQQYQYKEDSTKNMPILE